MGIKMKILLIGEFSGVHTNLKKGLSSLGVDVTLFNGGDGFKQFATDWKLSTAENNFIDHIQKFFMQGYYYHKIIKYDVVQFIHPNALINLGFSTRFINSILDKVPLTVLLSAGCDTQYARYAKKLGIYPCPACKKFDLPNNTCYFENHKSKVYEKNFLNKIDMIIPTTWEYMKIYTDYNHTYYSKVKPIIPFPIDIDMSPINITNNKKLVIFHPLNREGFKGTHIIREAFKILEEKYHDIATFVIRGKMPIDKYNQYVQEKVDILVDQLYGVSYGMGALYAMLQGKVVISGKRSSEIMNDDRYPMYANMPIYDLGTTVEEVVNSISKLIENKKHLNELKEHSRNYVIRYHDSTKIAKLYLELYKKGLSKT